MKHVRVPHAKAVCGVLKKQHGLTIYWHNRKYSKALQTDALLTVHSQISTNLRFKLTSANVINPDSVGSWSLVMFSYTKSGGVPFGCYKFSSFKVTWNDPNLSWLAWRSCWTWKGITWGITWYTNFNESTPEKLWSLQLKLGDFLHIYHQEQPNRSKQNRCWIRKTNGIRYILIWYPILWYMM